MTLDPSPARDLTMPLVNFIRMAGADRSEFFNLIGDP